MCLSADGQAGSSYAMARKLQKQPRAARTLLEMVKGGQAPSKCFFSWNPNWAKNVAQICGPTWRDKAAIFCHSRLPELLDTDKRGSDMVLPLQGGRAVDIHR
jgi:hypothetical protein